MYVPLYIKSNYTFLSSLVRIDKLIEKAKELGLKSLALCDSDMIAIMYFYKECKKNSIHPIIGIELSLDNNPILLYAKDFEGYKSLIKLNTIVSNRNLILSDLELYNKNVVCIVPFISRDLYNDLKKIYIDIYVGFSSNLEEMESLKISGRTIFINKVLYLDKKDSKYLKYLHMIRDKKNVLDNVEWTDNNNYLLSYDDVKNLSSSAGINNTIFLSSVCNVEFPKNTNLLPVYKTNLNVSNDEYLTSLSIAGLKLRLNNEVSEKYKTRLAYELDIIKKMGFSNYFLIVYDYVKYAKKKGILVGPGRGSAGGSLVAYALGIIDVNPIEYNLLFERFLNPGRITMPDIDVDFPDIYRDEVIDYVKNKYGEKNVSRIVAIGTLKAKAVLDDVAKVLKIPTDKVDKLKKYIPPINASLKDIYFRNNEFKNIIDNDDRMKQLYEIALVLEGFPRNITVHASGVVVSINELDDIVPLLKQDNSYVTAYEMEYLEELGLLKMDFLGNRNLTTVMQIIESIKKYENIDIDFTTIPLDDKEAIKLFYDIDTNGIFQFESDVMKNLLSRLKVEKFSDIVAADALVRPGPDTDTYIERKNNNSLIKYPSKNLIPVLEETYGVMIYQEQIMQIANILAGYSLSDADILRRAMGKKNSTILKEEEEKFIKGCINNSVSYEIAKDVYDDILAFAQYGFNKAHAVSYSMIAYKMAYLKVKYPIHFYLNLLSMLIGSEMKTANIIREAKNRNVSFYLPNINKSTIKYEIINNGILFPLSNIRNIGSSIAKDIIKIRKEGFIDIFDCLSKLCDINLSKKTIEILIYASCFEEYGYNKRTLIENLDNLLTYGFVAKGLDNDLIEHPSIAVYDEYSSDILMTKEKELFGFYLSYHPSTKYKEIYKVVNLDLVGNYYGKIIDTIILVEKVKIHIDKKDNKMAFITGSDELGILDYIIFSDTYNRIGDIYKGDILLIRGRVSKKNNYQIIADKIKKLSN